MSDHKTRIRKLEQRFTERAGARHLDECLDAFNRGDTAALQVQERIETDAGGRRGWVANLLCSILQPMADTPLVAPEDLMRPQA